MYATDFYSLFENQEDYLAVAGQINTEQKRQQFAKNFTIWLKLLALSLEKDIEVIRLLPMYAATSSVENAYKIRDAWRKIKVPTKESIVNLKPLVKKFDSDGQIHQAYKQLDEVLNTYSTEYSKGSKSLQNMFSKYTDYIERSNKDYQAELGDALDEIVHNQEGLETIEQGSADKWLDELYDQTYREI